MFTPSSWKLSNQIEDAMRRFDTDREQALLQKEAKANARQARAWEAEVKARYYASLKKR